MKKRGGSRSKKSFPRAGEREKEQGHCFFRSLFSLCPSLFLVAEMGTGASRLVGGGAQGASLADKGGGASGDAAAAAAAHDAPMADDKARLPTTTPTATSTSAALSEEDRASAAAAAAVACAFGLENFGNTCYCNSVLQVR